MYRKADTKRGYTYDQLKDATIAFGKGIQAMYSFSKGDVVFLFTPNSIDTPIIMHGTHWAGGIVSPANPQYTVDELCFQLSS